MKKEEALKSAAELMERTQTATVGSNGTEGYPHIKCMFKAGAEGLKTIWFSTNTSSKRVAQFREDPKACVYFLDDQKFMGLMLVGDMEVLENQEIKQRFWNDGNEIYYPLGVTDPDYCILQFTAKWGNYYHGLANASFEV